VFEHIPPRDQSVPNPTQGCGFIRQQQLIESKLVPFSPSTLWRKVKAGEFPQPVKISSHITAWRVSDIRAWASDPAAYRAPEVSHV
jgi:predicted DNA-binding transcriptional regulator AlpA